MLCEIILLPFNFTPLFLMFKKILLQTLGYIFNLTQYNAIEKLNFIRMF